VWYLTKYAQSVRFEVHSISSTVLSGQLKKLGMEWENVINATTMFGVSRSVNDQAAAQCRAHAWALRGD
jgi:hypothetical protein